jgi:hypothetical protein
MTITVWSPPFTVRRTDILRNNIYCTAVAAPTQLRCSEFYTLTEERKRQIAGSYGKLQTMQEQTSSESKYHKRNLNMFHNLYKTKSN